MAGPVDVPLPDELQHRLGRLHADPLVAQLRQLLVELPRVVVQGGGQLGRQPEEGDAEGVGVRVTLKRRIFITLNIELYSSKQS